MRSALTEVLQRETQTRPRMETSPGKCQGAEGKIFGVFKWEKGHGKHVSVL